MGQELLVHFKDPAKPSLLSQGIGSSPPVPRQQQAGAGSQGCSLLFQLHKEQLQVLDTCPKGTWDVAVTLCPATIGDIRRDNELLSHCPPQSCLGQPWHCRRAKAQPGTHKPKPILGAVGTPSTETMVKE